MNILIVTTSNARFGGPGGHPTGVWLEEFAVPYMELLAAGARIVVASPGGGAMPIDPRTSPDEGQRAAWAPALAAGQATVPLNGVRADDFDAVFIPGGHGPMFDLPDDPHLQSLLRKNFRRCRTSSPRRSSPHPRWSSFRKGPFSKTSPSRRRVRFLFRAWKKARCIGSPPMVPSRRSPPSNARPDWPSTPPETCCRTAVVWLEHPSLAHTAG